MKDECIICGAALEYLQEEIEMECAVCHKKEMSRTRCVDGHFVCSQCHTAGLDSIIGICMQSESRKPVEILETMMSQPFCHMHGPEHHVMVGAALLTAYYNAGGQLDLAKSLSEMFSRGKQVPGGACGFWGACGAGVSAGMFVSIATEATPLAGRAWGLANQMTGCALTAIGKAGGPRCCKRDSYLALQEAVKFSKEHLGVEMDSGEIRCIRSEQNNQCRKENCPFYVCSTEGKRPRVVFLCVHNSCRSQMAEALGKKYLSDLCDCYSAGTETKPQMNQDAVRLMKQVHGIDMEETQYSKLLDAVPKPDIVVSMGCNVVCPAIPGTVHYDWGLEDPTGQPDEVFFDVMGKIEEKMKDLREHILDRI